MVLTRGDLASRLKGRPRRAVEAAGREVSRGHSRPAVCTHALVPSAVGRRAERRAARPQNVGRPSTRCPRRRGSRWRVGVKPRGYSAVVKPDEQAWTRTLGRPSRQRGGVTSTSRTAVDGPVRTVVWEGTGGDCPPAPIPIACRRGTALMKRGSYRSHVRFIPRVSGYGTAHAYPRRRNRWERQRGS